MFGEEAGGRLVDLVGAVDFEELVQHMVEFLAVAGVALHCVLEGSHYEGDLLLQLPLLHSALAALLTHSIVSIIYYTFSLLHSVDENISTIP